MLLVYIGIVWKTSSQGGKKMEEIKHKFITVNDLKLHVAEIGNGQSVILFCHGFPEVWYTWRHQMVAAAKAGYRAIAPDYRGYGLSDPPSEPDKVTLFDFITDLRGLLDTMNISKVFVVGKDFGGPIASIFALLNKDRVYGVVTLGAPFMPVRSPSHHTPLPEGFYMNRWREPGRAESDFGRFDAKTVVRKIYIMFSKTEIPIANENLEIMDLVKPSDPLPPWITEEEFAIYGDSYEKSGFQTALQVPYRWFNESSDMSILQDPKIEAPSLLIVGEKDYVFKFPGIEEYIKGDEINVYVPNLEVKYIPEGSHFVHEQFPGRVNELLLGFLNKHRKS